MINKQNMSVYESQIPLIYTKLGCIILSYKKELNKK